MPTQLCETCLSSGRLLCSVEPYKAIFKKLLSDAFKGPKLKNTLVCWECRAKLDQFAKFTRIATFANVQLENTSLNNRSSLTNLSSLGSKTKEGFDYVYYGGDDISVSIKNEFENSVKGDVKVEKLTNTFVKTSVKEEVCDNGDENDETGVLDDNDYDVENEIDECPDESDISENAVDNKTLVTEIKYDASGRQNEIDVKKTSQKLTSEKAKLMYNVVEISEEEMLKSRDKERKKPNYLAAPYKCATCIKGFSSELNHQSHMTQFHVETAGNSICAICSSRFQTQSLLTRHTLEGHYRRFRCAACPFVCRKSDSVCSHYERQHECTRTFPCQHCSETFTSATRRKYHREKKHSESKCPLCDKILSTKTNLKRHIELHNSTHAKYHCDVCKKMFRHQASYEAHLGKHLGAQRTSSDPNAFCVECNKQFKNVYIFRSHLKNNSRHVDPESLKYECDVCGKKFVNKARLKFHNDLVHLKSTKYKCTECNRNFISHANMVKHIKFSHENIKPEKNQECTVCSRKFSTKTELKSHYRIHTGERPFKCAVCEATFTQHGALWTHNKLVHLKLKRKDKIRKK